jgi:hypothetical protein
MLSGGSQSIEGEGIVCGKSQPDGEIHITAGCYV